MCQATLLQQQHTAQQQQFAERILEHLAFNSDILERWHQIGTAQGLSTDLEVATFLIQHYENTWDRAAPTEFCMTCHSPLSLTCTKCSAPAPAPAPANAPNTSFSQLFDQGGGSGTNFVEPAHGKTGKRKKKKKGKVAEHGGDEDLMGLYIQFAQSQPPQIEVSSQVITVPFGSGLNGEGRLKSFVCVQCGKTFFKKSDFKKHVRIHTNERPFKCPYCPSAFSDSSSAARHRRIHTGEKPFQCELCPASFAQSSDRTKHMRIHSQSRPWSCETCTKSFADASSFAKHRRKHEKAEAKKARMLKAENEGQFEVGASCKGVVVS